MKSCARYLGGDLPLKAPADGKLKLNEADLSFHRGFRCRWLAPRKLVRSAEQVMPERVAHLVPWAMNYKHSGLFGDQSLNPLLYLTIGDETGGVQEALFETADAAALQEALNRSGATPPLPAAPPPAGG